MKRFNFSFVLLGVAAVIVCCVCQEAGAVLWSNGAGHAGVLGDARQLVFVRIRPCSDTTTLSIRATSAGRCATCGSATPAGRS